MNFQLQMLPGWVHLQNGNSGRESSLRVFKLGNLIFGMCRFTRAYPLLQASFAVHFILVSNVNQASGPVSAAAYTVPMMGLLLERKMACSDQAGEI